MLIGVLLELFQGLKRTANMSKNLARMQEKAWKWSHYSFWKQLQNAPYTFHIFKDLKSILRNHSTELHLSSYLRLDILYVKVQSTFDSLSNDVLHVYHENSTTTTTTKLLFQVLGTGYMNQKRITSYRSHEWSSPLITIEQYTFI